AENAPGALASSSEKPIQLTAQKAALSGRDIQASSLRQLLPTDARRPPAQSRLRNWRRAIVDPPRRARSAERMRWKCSAAFWPRVCSRQREQCRMEALTRRFDCRDGIF